MSLRHYHIHTHTHTEQASLDFRHKSERENGRRQVLTLENGVGLQEPLVGRLRRGGGDRSHVLEDQLGRLRLARAALPRHHHHLVLVLLPHAAVRRVRHRVTARRAGGQWSQSGALTRHRLTLGAKAGLQGKPAYS